MFTNDIDWLEAKALEWEERQAIMRQIDDEDFFDASDEASAAGMFSNDIHNF